MDLAVLRKGTRPLIVATQGETINLSYKPSMLTGELVNRVAVAAKDANNVEIVAEALAQVCDSWDVTDGGKAIEPTKDVLLGLPFFMLVDIFAGIQEDCGPKKQTDEGSF